MGVLGVRYQMGMPDQIMSSSGVFVNVAPGSIRHDMCTGNSVRAIMALSGSLRNWL